MANISSINGKPIVVGTSGISDGAVTEAKLGAGSVTRDKIADGAIVGDKIPNYGVPTAKLGTNSVTTTKVADEAITPPKLSSSSVTISQMPYIILGSKFVNIDTQNRTITIPQGSVIRKGDHRYALAEDAVVSIPTGTSASSLVYNADTHEITALAYTTDFQYPLLLLGVIRFATGNFTVSAPFAWSVNGIPYGIETGTLDTVLAPVTYDGYIGASGEYFSASANEERYTCAIPVASGDTINVRYSFSEARNAWTAVSLYDSEYNFLLRMSPAAAKVQNVSADFAITEQGCAYAVVAYRSYGEATPAIRVGSEHVNVGGFDNVFDMKRLNDTYDNMLSYYVLSSDNVVKAINHRGFYTAPENTMPAFMESLNNKFRYVETDVRFTSDSVPVLLHDPTINRTARTDSGESLEVDVPIDSITYAQALQYDFGLYKNARYAGTRIPTLEEFLVFCSATGLHPYIELKGTGNLGEQQAMQAIYDVVRQCAMESKCTYISSTDSYLAQMKAIDPKARLGIVGSGTIKASTKTRVKALSTGSNSVFVDWGVFNSQVYEACVDYGLELEIFNVDDIAAIQSMPPYVTGITSNRQNATLVKYYYAVEG